MLSGIIMNIKTYNNIISNVGIDFSSLQNDYDYITGDCIIYYEDSTDVNIRQFIYNKDKLEICIPVLTEEYLSEDEIAYAEQLLLENFEVNKFMIEKEIE